MDNALDRWRARGAGDVTTAGKQRYARKLHDDHILVQRRTNDFDRLTQRLGFAPDAVLKLDLVAFRAHFAELNGLEPDCRYYVNVRACTQLLEPAELVHGVGFQTYVYTRCK